MTSLWNRRLSTRNDRAFGIRSPVASRVVLCRWLEPMCMLAFNAGCGTGVPAAGMDGRKGRAGCRGVPPEQSQIAGMGVLIVARNVAAAFLLSAWNRISLDFRGKTAPTVIFSKSREFRCPVGPFLRQWRFFPRLFEWNSESDIRWDSCRNCLGKRD